MGRSRLELLWDLACSSRRLLWLIFVTDVTFLLLLVYSTFGLSTGSGGDGATSTIIVIDFVVVGATLIGVGVLLQICD